MKIVQIFQSRNTALLSALGMVLLVQTPKTIKIVSEMSQYGAWGGIYEGIVASLSIELAVVYFALNGKKWQTAIAMVGMIIINYGYYEVSILAGDPVAIMMMVITPILVWQITEVAGTDVPSDKVPVQQSVQPGTKEEKIREMLSKGVPMSTIASTLRTSKSTISKVKKLNGYKVKVTQ